MRTIELSKINASVNRYSDTDDVNEPQQDQQQAAARVTVNVDAIRCFYPRRNDQPGTRLTFTDGGGFAVTESYDDVKDAIGRSP